MIAAGFVIVWYGAGTTRLFDGAFVDDPFARFMKLLTLGGAGVATMLAFDEFRNQRILKFEYAILILLSTAGMLLMISAGDLIALYVGLELSSLALYTWSPPIAGIRCARVRLGLKYFVLGALSSGMLLYGSSLIYGFAGSTNFQVIANAAKGAEVATNLWLIFGLVFLLVGLAFKVSAVPFHMWTPDVYEGSSTPVTTFFATAPKVAAMALLVRVTVGAFPAIAEQWQQIITFMSRLPRCCLVPSRRSGKPTSNA